LNFVRIYNAEKLLVRTDLPILDISMEVGFSSISYFNRMFRRFKSCSPNHYRHAQYMRENGA
jgi:AraC-like DNA-binding protein